MADRYRGFAELAAHATRGVDYDVVVRTRERDPAIVVAAPHGGGIEPGSAELAERIAGRDHALYAFQGLRGRDNDALHVTSTRFDEPAAMALVTGAEAAVTVHGCRGRHERVYVGGLNGGLVARVGRALARAGFPVSDPPTGLQGHKPANLTNRARWAGVQLELSWPLRRRLLGELAGPGRDAEASAAGAAFIDAVRHAVAAWRAAVGTPERAMTPEPLYGGDPSATGAAQSRRGQPASAPVSGSSCSATELMQ